MPFHRPEFKLTAAAERRFGRSSLPLLLSLLVLAPLLMITGCRQPAAPETATPPAAASSPESPASVRGAGGEADDRPIVLAFGDSLTAGYGLPIEQSYTTLLQQRLDQAGYRYRVVNAGVSGDTTAGGLRRIEWSLDGPVKIVILALGGNDGLRGQPTSEMKKNLAAMIELAQARDARVLLAGMEAPPNLGPDYTRDFRRVYPELARQYRLPLIPFLLDGIGGRPELNQPDGIHPNAEGEKILVANVWRTLEPLLEK